MQSELERRNFANKVRVRDVDDGLPKIEGYGAVFYRKGEAGTEFQLWDGVFERIAPSAFDEAMSRGDDVRSFFNHDESIVLGRTSSNTLTLALDKRGLFFSATPPDTALVREQVLAPLRRGDVDGASFMFVPTKVEWTTEGKKDEARDIRTIESLELWEVGPVTFPAYESASSGVRSALASRRAESPVYREWLAYREQREREAEKRLRQAVAHELELEAEKNS